MYENTETQIKENLNSCILKTRACTEKRDVRDFQLKNSKFLTGSLN